MKLLPALACAAALCLSFEAAAEPTPAPAPHKKNWTPPAAKIRAQVLAEQLAAAHPELISVTLHGVPPGMDKVYSMFAGTFLDRIGNADDPDDVDVITKGITIVDPRYGKKDAIKKFVMMLPLRDASGGHLGLLVLAYKMPSTVAKTETDFFVHSTGLRDELAKQIPAYADLFKPAN
jgi:hypothetical protein